MADAENPQFTLLPNDIIGILHRQTAELAHYLAQPIGGIDASVPVAYLDRMQMFAQELMAMQNAAIAQNREQGEQAPARKN